MEHQHAKTKKDKKNKMAALL